jgi:hypothetical protein
MKGYRIGHSIEPPHPRCTISDPAHSATDERTGARVVLKELALGFPLAPDAAARWLTTMRAADSPHRVRVVDVGFTDDRAPCYVMEHVDGEPLAARIERGERSTHAQVRTTLQQLAASGADDVHARHIMVSAAGVRVWNVGVAAWKRYAHGLVEGRYTAPGQIRWYTDITPAEAIGRPSTLAARLALIAFAMLAGRFYWDADNDPDASTMQLLTEAMRGVGAPPSSRTDVALGAEFDAWFAACLTGANRDAAGTFPG